MPRLGAPEVAHSGFSIAVDIGGTFTDLVAFDEATGRVLQAKSLTTPAELSQGVWDCLSKAGLAPREAQSFVHGSTIAINIAIEQKGARTALVVTRGTRDVYKIGRQNRPQAYDFFFKRPVPLVPRSRTFEVDERMLASGDVLTPLQPEDARRVVDAVRASGAEAVAVCFLHSYIRPEHEAQMASYLHEAFDGQVYLTVSNEIIREYREYERTSTTVMNAYIGPKTSEYIGRMENRLTEDGFTGQFLIMQSNGGVMAPATAKKIPVAMMESGPVGGVMAAAELSKRLAVPGVIAFDMGGTTAKTSLVQGGEASVAQGYYVGGYASGHPVMLPVVDIVEVGAGGGSIAWIDDVGALKVGPRSAGAAPGPIAYGRGGTEPTVTDANVVLGRISPASFLGGEMALDADAARIGLSSLGHALGMSPTQVAHGIIQIAVAKMSLAVRGVSVERGYDPRDFSLVAMGGGGPPHALAIARDLHIPQVIIPNLPAHFSALGMLMTDVRHDYVRTYYQPLLDADFSELVNIYAELIGSGRATLNDEGVDASAHTYEHTLDLRYVGQEFSVQVPVTEQELGAGDAAGIKRRFDEIYDRRFGNAAQDEPLELVNLRLTARGARPKIGFPKLTPGSVDPRIGTRPIYFDDRSRPVEAAVFQRARMAPGTRAQGPAVIEEYGSTTVLFDGDTATITDTGEIVISVGAT